MHPGRILFLSPINAEQSVRQRELQESEMRAHAARVSRNSSTHKCFRGDRNKRTKQKLRKSKKHYGPLFQQELGVLAPLHGCSDPFNAFPLHITPEINQLITHIRDILLPNIYIPPFMKRLTPGLARPLLFQDSINVIGGSSFVREFEIFSKGNEGTCLAWLSSHMPAMRRVTSGRSRGDSPVDEFKMRAKSLLLLQQELRKHPEHSPKALATVQSHVRMLFKGECMSQDVNAAKVHAQTFLKLDDQFMDEIEHAHHALVVMYSVTELACKRLERTIIPFGIYLINAISNFWTATSCQLPQASAGTEKVHACLTNPWLRNAFLRTRYCLSIEEGSIPSTTPAERLRGDMLFGWIATWTFFDMGTLMNIYIDLIEEEVPTDSEGKQLVEACLILTFLHVLRKCIHEAPINGVDLRDASQVMIPRLQMDLQRALRTLKPREYLYYNDAILWMLYIGAVHERGLRPGNLVARDEAASGAQTWFTRTFAKQAYKMNIWTWADALAVLSQFIYSEHLCPPGHLWFDEVICA